MGNSVDDLMSIILSKKCLERLSEASMEYVDAEIAEIDRKLNGSERLKLTEKQFLNLPRNRWRTAILCKKIQLPVFCSRTLVLTTKNASILPVKTHLKA